MYINRLEGDGREVMHIADGNSKNKIVKKSYISSFALPRNSRSPLGGSGKLGLCTKIGLGAMGGRLHS